MYLTRRQEKAKLRLAELDEKLGIGVGATKERCELDEIVGYRSYRAGVHTETPVEYYAKNPHSRPARWENSTPIRAKPKACNGKKKNCNARKKKEQKRKKIEEGLSIYL